MIAIATVALFLGVESTRRRWAFFRSLAREHETQSTLETIEEARFLITNREAEDAAREQGRVLDRTVGSYPIYQGLARQHAAKALEHLRKAREYATRW